MDYIELIAIIILIAAIVFLVYYYIQTAREGNINIKEVLKFSPKNDDDTSLNFAADDEIKEKVSMGEKIKYTFKDIDKSYANTTDAFSKRLDAFLDERSEELIESWSLVTTDDLSSLEERCTTACDSIDALEKRFGEYTNATDSKIQDLDKRLKALEEAEKELEDAEEAEKELEEVKVEE